MIADISQVGGFQGIPDPEQPVSRIPSFKSALLGKIGQAENREAGAEEYENCKYMSCHAAELRKSQNKLLCTAQLIPARKMTNYLST